MSEQAIAKVKAAAAEGKEVQFRRCAACGEVQGRIQAKDGSFKRWSKCGCPSPAKSGGGAPSRENGDAVAEAAARQPAGGTHTPPPVDVGVQSSSGALKPRSDESRSSSVAGEGFVHSPDPSPALDLPLHRDTVTRIDKHK